MQRPAKVWPYILFIVPILVFTLLFVDIPWGEEGVYWRMALIFHAPLLIFFVIAILVEIVDWQGKRRPGAGGR